MSRLKVENLRHPDAASDSIVLTSGANVNFDSGTLFVDATNNRVGIGTTSPSSLLAVHQASASTANYINITNDATGTSSLSNGMLLGVNTSGAAICWQNENLDLLFGTNNTERARIDSSGRLLVGTSTGRTANSLNASFQLEGTSAATGSASLIRNGGNPYFGLYRTGSASIGSVTAVPADAGLAEIDFGGADGTNVATGAYILAVNDSGSDWTASSHPTRLAIYTTASGSTTPTERLRIDSSGNLKFNSGYGSVATVYGCRAWVSFNGQGTAAIRASGNVSSITDHGTGDYTVNFTTTMPDANYSGSGWAMNGVGAFRIVYGASDAFPSSSGIRIAVSGNALVKADADYVHFQVFR